MRDLICISHLSWHTPDHPAHRLPSRFSRPRRILFVAPPEIRPGIDAPYLEISPSQNPSVPRVKVAKLLWSESAPMLPAFSDEIVHATYVQHLLDFFEREPFSDPTLWLYTPLALEFADYLPHRLLVYDAACIPAQPDSADGIFTERETRLVSRANVVIYRRRQ